MMHGQENIKLDFLSFVTYGRKIPVPVL